jgi:hypothetical protein
MRQANFSLPHHARFRVAARLRANCVFSAIKTRRVYLDLPDTARTILFFTISSGN